MVIEKSETEVTTYSELEFMREKRMYLTGKRIEIELDPIELKMLENISSLLREIDNKS